MMTMQTQTEQAPTDFAASGGSKSGQPKPASIGQAAYAWWEKLKPVSHPSGRKSGDAGAFARLRRGGLNEALLEPCTIALYESLRGLSRLPKDSLYERCALIAAVLAHVKSHASGSVAAACGHSTDGRKRVSQQRLQKLFGASSSEDSLISFRRLIALLGHKANIADLSESLYDWGDSEAGQKRRITWAYDYHKTR